MRVPPVPRPPRRRYRGCKPSIRGYRLRATGYELPATSQFLRPPGLKPRHASRNSPQVHYNQLITLQIDDFDYFWPFLHCFKCNSAPHPTQSRRRKSEFSRSSPPLSPVQPTPLSQTRIRHHITATRTPLHSLHGSKCARHQAGTPISGQGIRTMIATTTRPQNPGRISALPGSQSVTSLPKGSYQKRTIPSPPPPGFRVGEEAHNSLHFLRVID